MSEIAAGWYPDPSPQNTDGLGQRYWDGGQWTEHLHHPYAPAAPLQTQYYVPPSSSTTPDGQELASYGARVGALVLDGFISFPLQILVMTPLVISQWSSLHHWFDALSYASDHGTADPPVPALFRPGAGPWFTFLLCALVAQLVYQLIFLLWKQATPGKLILGLRVRLRDQPDLPPSAVFARVGMGLLIGLCSIVVLLDYLWPLWDDKRQALHDKVARTNVVRKAQ
ncbi:MAG: domain containing protein [Marmoricola sp.]|nr:domain containing protein [Marmoricola sp.]